MNKRLFILKNRMILAKVIAEHTAVWELENPMFVEYELDINSNVSFRYLPWQIISEENEVRLQKEEVVFVTTPRKELEQVYDEIQPKASAN